MLVSFNTESSVFSLQVEVGIVLLVAMREVGAALVEVVKLPRMMAPQSLRQLQNLLHQKMAALQKLSRLHRQVILRRSSLSIGLSDTFAL